MQRLPATSPWAKPKTIFPLEKYRCAKRTRRPVYFLITLQPMPSLNTDTRQHILDAAKPIILGKGFTAVGLSALLAAAAVPKGSFYHYFKSKEAFGEALLDGYFEAYLQRLDDVLSQAHLNAAQRLMQYWQAWVDTQCSEDIETKCLVVKLGGEVSDLSEAMRLALQRGTARIVAQLAECIAQGCAEGSLPATLKADDCAQMLYSQWLGATILAKISREREPLESALAATRELFALTPNTKH